MNLIRANMLDRKHLAKAPKTKGVGGVICIDFEAIRFKDKQLV
jgi:hypothetical protein